MSETASLESLKSQKASYTRQLNDLKDAQRKKIKRLKEAYDNIHDLKNDFETVKKGVKNFDGEKRRWEGEQKSEIDVHMRLVMSANDYQDEYIDSVQDCINLEITALENEMLNGWGLFGRLASRINSLGTQIANFFN